MTDNDLNKIINELASKIPSAPSEVDYSGVYLNDKRVREREPIKVTIDWPRWYRHPEEYDEYSPGRDKELNKIRNWEDQVFAAIGEIEKKYGIKIEQSA